MDDVVPNAELLNTLVRPLRAYFSPKCYGLKELDLSKPKLFVGNHGLYSVDAAVMVNEIHREHGVLVRSLGDRLHFHIPGWRELLTAMGTVEGSRENCTQLMQSQQSILVFPGGGREVWKNKGEAYQLIWKNRKGFAEMAIQNQYEIIPFAAYGADEMLDILWDANDFRASLIGRTVLKNQTLNKWLRNGDAFAPLSRGLGLTPIPRPVRFYFSFGKPLNTPNARYESAENLRDAVAESILSQIQDLAEKRDEDETVPLFHRPFKAGLM